MFLKEINDISQVLRLNWLNLISNKNKNNVLNSHHTKDVKRMSDNIICAKLYRQNKQHKKNTSLLFSTAMLDDFGSSFNMAARKENTF